MDSAIGWAPLNV